MPISSNGFGWLRVNSSCSVAIAMRLVLSRVIDFVLGEVLPYSNLRTLPLVMLDDRFSRFRSRSFR